MGLFKTIAEGGQIWAHRVRMVRQVVRIAVLSSLAIAGVFFSYRMAQVPKVYYQSAWYYGKAYLLEISDSEVPVLKKNELHSQPLNDASNVIFGSEESCP